MKLLILGGYGVFGGRLASLLADEPRLTLLIAGRHLERAQAFCQTLPEGGAARQALRFDREGDLRQQLQAIRPDIVVDASGPFQRYGGDPYRLIRCCIALGIHYLDLADSSSFVQSVSNFDAAAQDAGVFVLSGVSSFPVLTAAVVRALTPGWRRVRRIEAGIAPSPYAGVGLNVIRAIAAYAGRPVGIIRGSKAVMAPALIDARRYTIAPPGCLRDDPMRVDRPRLRQKNPRRSGDLQVLFRSPGPAGSSGFLREVPAFHEFVTGTHDHLFRDRNFTPFRVQQSGALIRVGAVTRFNRGIQLKTTHGGPPPLTGELEWHKIADQYLILVWNVCLTASLIIAWQSNGRCSVSMFSVYEPPAGRALAFFCNV